MNPTQVIERFAELLSAGDTAAALALYEPDAAFVVEPGTVATGHDAIGVALNQFAALRPVLTGHVEQVVQADDVALVVNRWTLAGTTPTGDAVHMEGRSADVLRRGADGNWRITIDDPWGGAG
jgi:uncharacterized protein (TIGR02246 family)